MGIRIALALAVVSAAFAADAPDDPWSVLQHITRRGTYTIISRDFGCLTGRFREVTSKSVSVRSESGKQVILQRDSVLRVSDGPGPSDVVYSARSSWLDVQKIVPDTRERLGIVTKSGSHLKGKLVAVTDEEIALIQSGRRVQVKKRDVTQVFYLREKPTSDSAVRAAQEMYVIDPELWPHLLHISGLISVRLYDSSMPEEEQPIECKPERKP